MNEVIKSAIEKIHLQVDQKNGKLTADLSAKESIIYADKVHITNIIFNLLDNALKYSKKIPAKKLAAAAKKGGKEGQRARLAVTLKGLKK